MPNKMRLGLPAAVILFWGAGAALACSCGDEVGIRERAQRSALVFEGELKSQTVDSAAGKVRMTFKVKRFLKAGAGFKRKRITVESELSEAACGFSWPIGKPSVIFTQARPAKKGKIYESTLCSGNILEPQKEQLDSLRRYR